MFKMTIVALAVCAFNTSTAHALPLPTQAQEDVTLTELSPSPAPQASQASSPARKAKRSATPRRTSSAPWLAKLKFSSSNPQEVRDLFASQVRASKGAGESPQVPDVIERDDQGNLVRTVSARQVLIGDQRYDLKATFDANVPFQATLHRLIATTSAPDNAGRANRSLPLGLSVLRGFSPIVELPDNPRYGELVSRLAHELQGGKAADLLQLLEARGLSQGAASGPHAPSITQVACGDFAAALGKSGTPLDLKQLQAYVDTPHRLVPAFVRTSPGSPDVAAKDCGAAPNGTRTLIFGERASMKNEFTTSTLTSMVAGSLIAITMVFALSTWPAWIAGLAAGFLLYSNWVMAALIAAAAGMAAAVVMMPIIIIRALVRRDQRARQRMLAREAAKQYHQAAPTARATSIPRAAGAAAGVAAAVAAASTLDDDDDHYSLSTSGRHQPGSSSREISVDDTDHSFHSNHTIDHFDHHDHWTDDFSVNPANGMPMVGGMGGIDIHGNTFGSNFNDF